MKTERLFRMCRRISAGAVAKSSGAELAALLLFLAMAAFSLDSVVEKKERSWSFNGYVKDMQTIIIHRIEEPWVTNNLLHNRNNFKWNISESFTFCLQERNRFYWGNLTAISPQYASFIAYDNGVVNLSWNVLKGSRMF